MADIGKYQILGGLLSLGGTCYGSYAIYNQYGRGSSNSKINNKKTEQPEKKEVLTQGTTTQPSEETKDAEGNIEHTKTEEAKEEQTEKTESKVIENAEEQTQLQSDAQTLVSHNPSTIRRFTSNRYEFMNEDGSIIIRPNTIGDQFKDYLITSTNNEEIWREKLNAWKEDMEYYETRKKIGIRNYETEPVIFTLKSNQDLRKELQKKCYNAYSKKQGEWVNSVPSPRSHRPYNKWTRAREYWDIVWKYCGKPEQHKPKGWYPV